MAIRFKSTEKFSGKLGESITEHINNYLEVANEYGLDHGEKFLFFYHIFDGEAKRFYRIKVLVIVDDFASACQMMQEEFNNITRQNRVRKYLQSLRLNSIIKSRNCSIAEALEELRETITRYSPQGPMTHRSEEDKVDYLYKPS